MSKAALTKRMFLLGLGAAAGWLGAARFQAKNPSMDGTTSLQPNAAPQTVNDASGLSQTRVAKHITIRQDTRDTLISELRAEFKAARAERRPVAIAAARHSMGGQSIPVNGSAYTYQLDRPVIELDSANSSYRTSAGARWSDIIAHLDPRGFSPKVMQSNNDFGVGATFCVNAHGWPVPHSGMGSTVRQIRLLMADGSLVTCSPTENTELFNLSMGGYGLTGVIIDMDVEMLPNALLRPTFSKLPGKGFGTAFAAELAKDPTIQMGYGRLNVDRAAFFEQGLMITYSPSGDQADIPAVTGSGFLSKASKPLFRGQLGNEPVKRLRWQVETGLGAELGSGPVSRNALLNEPVITLDDGDPALTDILHEYFVPPERFAEFVTLCQRVIPASYQELLNITLRYVTEDTQSVLAYATGPRIACVMLFSQEMTARAEADMARMTRSLIEAVLSIGGTYYLPYRLHASADQFRRSYPRAAEFAAGKRKYDPQLLFRNKLWDSYLSHL
jgi:hypothetical protein